MLIGDRFSKGEVDELKEILKKVSGEENQTVELPKIIG